MRMLPLALLLAFLVPTLSAGADELEDRFTTIRKAIAVAGGLEPSDDATLRTLAARARTRVTQNPLDVTALAIHLQLTLWRAALADDETKGPLQEDVYADYLALARLHPNDARLAIAGYEYAIEADLLDEAALRSRRDEIIAQFPEDPGVYYMRGISLYEEERYADVIDLIEPLAFTASDPDLGRLLAESYVAEHRFDDALELVQELLLSLDSTGDAATAAPVRVVERSTIALQTAYNIEVPRWEAEAEQDDLPRVALETSRGRIVVELYENEEPNHVANFISLCEQGFYDGTAFHRYARNQYIAGGDPLSKEGVEGEPGRGDAGYTIADGAKTRAHLSGALSYEKIGANNSSCRFVLTMAPMRSRDRQHACFGRVIEGLDVLRTLRKDDVLTRATVIRKRDHAYEPVTILPEGAAGPDAPTGATEADSDAGDGDDVSSGG